MKGWISHLLAAILAALFFWAGAVKMGASEQMALTIARFSVLPEAWIQLASVLLPWIETLAAILILIPRTRALGAFLICGLVCLFTLAIARALAFGWIIDCHCFGSSEPAEWKMWAAIARNLAILAAAGWLLIHQLWAHSGQHPKNSRECVSPENP